jgi:MoxR-like ATPase
MESNMSNQTKEAEITYLDTVQPVDVKFLTYPYLPLGKISLLIGDPGIGKSTIAINIASYALHR